MQILNATTASFISRRSYGPSILATTADATGT